MIELSYRECELVEGGAWAAWIIPLAIGLVTGGPVGGLAVVATFIATKGVDNLEHLHHHGSTPSMGDMFGHSGNNKGGGR